MIMIIWNHIIERAFTYPLFSNPTQYWGTLAERIGQLTPFSGYGWGDLPLNLFRYVGWLGDQGVQLFLITSGFGLTWSLLQRNSEDWRSFYQRRLWKLYPLWWFVHGVFLITSLFLKNGMSVTQPQFYLSLLGFRMTPGIFYYFSPSWWFIGLLIQLYLLFPLLYSGLKKWGAMRFLVGTSAIAFLIRGIGLYLIGDPYLDLWSRGNIAITRLPEFVLGMAFAAWLYQSPEATAKWFRSPKFIGLGVVIYGAGLVGAFTLWGMAMSPFLLGLGLLILLYPLLNQSGTTWADRVGLRWVGRHSYGLFLVHHPIIVRLIPEGTVSVRSGIGAVLAVGVTIFLTLFAEWGVSFLSQKFSNIVKKK